MTTSPDKRLTEAQRSVLWSPPPALNPRWAIWRRETGGVRSDCYVVWISERWREFDALNGGEPAFRDEENHRQFDEWLLKRARMIGAIPGEDVSVIRFWCAIGPTEVCDKPAIYLDDLEGGDMRVVCTIDRVHRLDDLRALCKFASAVIDITEPAAAGRAALRTDKEGADV